MKRFIAVAMLIGLVVTGCGSTNEIGDDTLSAEQRVAKQERQAERRAAQRRAKLQRQKAEERREARQAARIAVAKAEAEAEAEAKVEKAALAEEAESECDPNYAGACLDPNSSDYDCAGGSGDGPDYTGYVEVVGTDIHDLDSEGNGIGCE